MTMTAQPTTATPTIGSLFEPVRALAVQLSARARETEELATLPGDLAAAAKAAGLFRMAMPTGLGGLEVEPAAFIEIAEELCRADASAGWCTIIGNATSFFAWLEPSVATELLAGQADIAVAGSFAPMGRLAASGTGRHRLTGRWSFMSGCLHADWFFQGAFVMEGDTPRMVDGRGPDWRLAALPAKQVDIIENWDVAGLRGTGSHDVSVPGVVVPDEHTIAPFFEPARHDGAMWRFPFFTLIGAMFVGFPLGVARRALDEFTAISRTKQRAGSTTTMANEDDVQIAIARAEGGLQAARSFVFDSLGILWETACRGDVPDVNQRARFLLANQEAMRAAIAAVDTAFTLSGASAIYSDHPLQRCFRDLHAGAQHIYFSPAASKRYAKTRLGIDQPTFMF